MKTWFLLLASLSILISAPPLLVAQTSPSTRQLTQGSKATDSTKRVALVIGNGSYGSAPALKNPPNDARDMAATLTALGFDVSSGVNVSQREMKRLIREFGQKLKGGGSGLFYYAGHGVQSKGRNYLIPIDAEIQSEAEVEDSGVDVGLVLNYMDEAQNGLNIVILDACRNNPFGRSFRSAAEGLAQVDAPTGTLIAYATAPGRVASDGSGQNGLYTSELLKQMRVPSVSVTDMFMRVRAEVMKQTGNKQVPWEASSLVGAFYFSGSGGSFTADVGNEKSSGSTRISDTAIELSYWDSIKNSSDPEDFRSYLEKYPNGQFTDLARRRAERATLSSSPPEPRLDTDLAKQFFTKGNELVSQKNFPSAESQFREAIKLDPNNAQYHKRLGDVLYDQNRFGESEQEYREALKADSNNATLHAFLADTLRKQQKEIEADAEYVMAVRLAPSNADVHFRYGNALYNRKRYEEAEAEYTRAAQLKPDDAMIHAYLGDTLYILKKYREAETQYQTAVRLAPGNAAYQKTLKEIQRKK